MGVGISLEVTGLSQIDNRFRRIIRRTPRSIRTANRYFVPKLRSILIAHASGRPGPEIQSGAYIRSIQVISTETGVLAWTDAPQALRLEHGFVGIDSLGRHYAQPPYPVFQPSLIEAIPLYQADVHEMVEGMLKE